MPHHSIILYLSYPSQPSSSFSARKRRSLKSRALHSKQLYTHTHICMIPLSFLAYILQLATILYNHPHILYFLSKNFHTFPALTSSTPFSPLIRLFFFLQNSHFHYFFFSFSCIPFFLRSASVISSPNIHPPNTQHGFPSLTLVMLRFASPRVIA